MILFDPATSMPALPSIDPRERAYLEMMAQGVPAHVANVATRWRVLAGNGRVLPVTVDDGRPGDSYVCTPSAAYVDYARAEIDIVRMRGGGAARLLLGGIGALLRRAGIDRIVNIDNWLLSTNLHGDWDGTDLPAIRALLAREYPGHILAIRSLDDWSQPSLAAAARDDGWVMVPSRQIWVVDDLAHAWRPRNQYGNDRRLLARSGLNVDAARLGDAARIADLYRQLYVGKYSALNPVFTSRFVAATMTSGLIDYRVARDADGLALAVAGSMARGGIVTPPVVGYDRTLPLSAGLYRIASFLFMQAAMDRGLRLHASAGAGHFKRMRGARGVIEYWAMQVDHLAPARAATIRAFAALLRTVAVPMMRRNGW